MVLSDITNDYDNLMKVIDAYKEEGSFLNAAFSFIDAYYEKINEQVIRFLKSFQRDGDKNSLASALNGLQSDFTNELAIMGTSLRKTTFLVEDIEKIEFRSISVKECAERLCSNLNILMDLIEKYIDNKLRGQSNEDIFFELVERVNSFRNLYTQVEEEYSFITSIEKELMEELPDEWTEETEISYLDIRSYKKGVDISDFSDDVRLLSECMQSMERLLGISSSNKIFVRKIESGSLKALFGSDKNIIDLSIFPDLIGSITNAIKTFRLIPAEKKEKEAEAEKTKAEAELLKAQTEAQRIQNEGSKLEIANNQISFLCEKLNLDPENPECKEQIQKLCIPLITYIEHNPVGSINGIPYDISKEVHLLETK